VLPAAARTEVYGYVIDLGDIEHPLLYDLRDEFDKLRTK